MMELGLKVVGALVAGSAKRKADIRSVVCDDNHLQVIVHDHEGREYVLEMRELGARREEAAPPPAPDSAPPAAGPSAAEIATDELAKALEFIERVVAGDKVSVPAKALMIGLKDCKLLSGDCVRIAHAARAAAKGHLDELKELLKSREKIPRAASQ